MVAGAPRHSAFFIVVRNLISLAIDAGLVNMRAANSARVDVDF